MSKIIDFPDWLRLLPTADSLSGMSILAMDAQGNLHKASAAKVAEWLASTNLIPSYVKLQVGTDMDANALTTQSCTIYAPTGDMNKHTAAFLNFPGNKPEGGFSLICIKEGLWQRQIYMRYSDYSIYIRSNQFNQAGNRWLPWYRALPEAVN
ncbi:MAG: hypothetical protein HDS07_00370 [Bacteroides sp.]|nr:hypothetical protein [Bacteroides sp.]